MLTGVHLPGPLTEPTVIEGADLLRSVVLVGCALLAVVSLVLAVHRRMSRWQRSRFLCLIFAALFIGGTEFQQLHKAVVVWRLPAALAFLALSLYGVYGLRSGRDRLPDHPPRAHSRWHPTTRRRP